MKKVFTILITFLLALSLIGVASAVDDPVFNYNDPSNYESISAGAGSDVDVHYSVNQEVVVRIPSDVTFDKDVHHVHDNLTVEKSHIEDGKYLNVYVKSEFNWKMQLAHTSNGITTYDPLNNITYHMKYDTSKDGQISGVGDVSINGNIDSDDDGDYDDPVCILSLRSGVSKHRFAIGFAIDSQSFSKSGSFEDKLRFTFSIDNNANAGVNGCIINNSDEAINP